MENIKLHLGCGTRYLNGYINIDHPPDKHTVQSHLIADRYEDIQLLKYSASSVSEIRLHHVFEHFPRQIALAILCRWVDWLKPGGTLHIETPDVMRSAWALISPLTSRSARSQIVRHLFGSHEASWAMHWDGWYAERFKTTLHAFDFKKIRFQRTRWGALRNIEVMATRSSKRFSAEEYETIVRDLLKKSLVSHISRRSFVDIADSELKMLNVWMAEWRQAYYGGYSEPLRQDRN